MSIPGTYADPTLLSPGTIAAGTAVPTFYLHSFGNDVSGDIFSGSITLALPILGVEALDASLVATNADGSPTATSLTTSSGKDSISLTLRRKLIT